MKNGHEEPYAHASYRIAGPTHIAFSGGRTSAYMLYHILAAHDGKLPSDVVVSFQNTGREMPETLDFVADCARHWSVPITWLERDSDDDRGFRTVGHNDAARNGEPFQRLVEERGYLPNAVARFCTAELKVRVAKRYMLSLGYSHWTSVLGLRADEAKRVARACAPTKERWQNHCPLADAGITKRQISAFWKRQTFDLRLANVEGKTPLGNCDGCFLKSEKTLAALIRDFPERAQWWLDVESGVRTRGRASRFNKNFALADLASFVDRQGDWVFDQEDALCDAPHGFCE
ncbi:phosphoadenosine phosphosulfate reductase family protein [Pelagibius sp. Alg239-R121]|uniref:phosphoadenosine phosphosulfate reductase family protein n=1 Tax=Pelagibius sp. Alg239-R121 TaxID=2993448 RepID=UPI0024A6AED3|nr:phosphoadenosine phosphosulfate reductase family protein [Pelagibius sp. Alg239-R121]